MLPSSRYFANQMLDELLETDLTVLSMEDLDAWDLRVCEIIDHRANMLDQEVQELQEYNTKGHRRFIAEIKRRRLVETLE